MPKYDLESMRIAAGQVEKLQHEFEESKKKVTGFEHENDNPFKGMTGADDAHGATDEFKKGVHKEFDAGGAVMAGTASALRKAMQLMQEADQIGADNVTLHEDKSRKA
ncbi:hypothetical protein [Amycolatopsis sp. NPDC059657]|uniref:hypothetical protein n=1 Tax=Amycolatopsis sp. NPDC059657 TaxID=3346899 RepID=UPI00366AB3DD